ncbi:class I SAM-dependent methyltransferase [Rhodopirellula halodulae]|uniref:class I SAM-dependent methyltransferase n=1 Tax=Rhodopirellula halodulae TaxID=2894198 RepID=UPI001E4C949A|nr:class I SAM-dependent methyltransferase [Rhodopirellula sp. JC737]MCC9656798.1 class I SAM-dependent methyltransferase [Rhodopirellula sp. JC737]
MSDFFTPPKPVTPLPSPEVTARQSEEFAARLRKRAKHLRRWPTKQGITCFRLYERDVPEVPLVVDRYEDHLHIGEFERPHNRTDDQHAVWLEHMVKVAAQTLDVPRSKTFFKQRKRQRGTSQHETIASRHYEIEAHEGGLKFVVNLSDYIDTGLFLDHRITRSMVRDEVTGKRFLNLFAYTGSFTVYAADGGAASTTTVDLSNTYVQWAQQNMRLNGFEGEQHQFIAGDAIAYVKNLAATEVFDVVVIDPPTFSNSKRTQKDWIVQDNYVGLLRNVLRHLSRDGVIYFSNNYRKFQMDGGALEGANVHEISRQTVPDDFRNRRIHRCWRITRTTNE